MAGLLALGQDVHQQIAAALVKNERTAAPILVGNILGLVVDRHRAVAHDITDLTQRELVVPAKDYHRDDRGLGDAMETGLACGVHCFVPWVVRACVALGMPSS